MPDVAGDLPVPVEMATIKDAHSAFFPDGDDSPVTPFGGAWTWWTSMIHREQFPNATGNLTLFADDWDFDRLAVDLAGLSIMGGALLAPDAPENVAFVRFIPGFTRPVQFFGEHELTEGRLLTLIYCDDTWWRAYWWSDFQQDRFPSGAEVLAELHARCAERLGAGD